MKSLPIPDRFQIAGLTFRVVKDTDFGKKANLAGHCDHTKQIVIVDTGTNHQQSQEQTLLHEQIHACLTIMGEDELNQNEQFVDLLAHLLYQALTSGEFAAGEPEEDWTTPISLYDMIESSAASHEARRPVESGIPLSFEIPDHVIEWADYLTRFFQRNNIKGWRLGGCADRNLIEEEK